MEFKVSFKQPLAVLLVSGILMAALFDWPSILYKIFSRIHGYPENEIFSLTLLLLYLALSFALIFGEKLLRLNRQVEKLKEQERELRFFSEYDMLTGSYNRNAFDRQVQMLKKTAELSVLVCDIDGLKIINDTLGHAAGDEVIRIAAEILRQNATENSKIYRMGGDKFLILQPAEDGAIDATAAAIQRAVADYNQAKLKFPISLSLGCSEWDEANTELNDRINLADKRMYKDKRDGREFVQKRFLKNQCFDLAKNQ